MRGSALQSTGEVLAKLGHLRRHHVLAIRLLGVGPEVSLMVVLRWVERPGSGDLRYNRAIEETGGRQLSDLGLRGDLLFGRVKEDRRPVLSADVISLPIERLRVVDGEEDVQDVREGNDVR